MAGDTVRCTTREEIELNRLVTECRDGSRAITRYDEALKQWDMQVITPPKTDKPPRGWSVPGKPPR
jgi:hypothetical protein